ncbi:hypothetical protein LJR168_001390 [Pseudoxanthomonas sp. LjRoot168]|uniref:hypothetical protein n=1 Tax=Pseudoxanthomonas sp. LjRoot168 TaxID=3342274 RepID=UPI003ECC4CAB
MGVRHWLVAAALLVSSPAWAKGPTGIGSLQLGLTPAQVEALPKDGVYLATPLGPYKSPGNKPVELKPGEERFSTTLQTPWQTEPLEASLTFIDGKLTSLYINMGDNERLATRVAVQIEEKFGPAKLEDSTRVERCPTYGGGSEEVRSGSNYSAWSEVQGDKEVRARVGTYVLDGCLSRRYNQDRKVLASISIYTVEATKNPF